MKPVKSEIIHFLGRLTIEWNETPVLIPACLGGSDAHLQIWHPKQRKLRGGMPSFIVRGDGTIEHHPDDPTNTNIRIEW